VVALLLTSAPLLAHHSLTAEFDTEKTVQVQGTITEMKWTNPHGWLYLNVKDKDGKIENWAIETGAPMQLIRRGGDKKTLAVGTELIIDGWLARDGSRTVNGRAIKSCSILAVQANGAEVLTIEGMANGDKLHPVQQAFTDCHALQCGFCTPGMIMATAALLKDNPRPTDEEIYRGLEGNLCRCTGYINIVKAVKQAAQTMK